MIIIKETIEYVVAAPYFWNTMGMITASAMFLGATIYNGDVGKITKWLVTTVPYTMLLIATNIMRIHSVEINSHIQAFAGSISILFVSFFYFFGMMLGVLLLSLIVKKDDIDHRRVCK